MKRVLCGFAAFLVATASVAQAPVNDNPAGAIPVFDGINPGAPTGASGSFFSNINATDTSPYGTPCGSANHSDVFFIYTAGGPGRT